MGSTNEFLIEHEISIDDKTKDILDELDCALEKFSQGTTPINNPGKTLKDLLYNYHQIASQEVTDYNANNELIKTTLENFIETTVLATSAFQDIVSIGQFYEVLNIASDKCFSADSFQTYEIGEDELNIFNKCTEELTKLCLTIGSEVDFANKSNKGYVTHRYLVSLKSIVSTQSLISQDEPLKIANSIAGKLRYCQHNMDLFEENVEALIKINESYSAIGTIIKKDQ